MSRNKEKKKRIEILYELLNELILKTGEKRKNREIYMVRKRGGIC
jgi:hypothetical protein